MRLHAREYRKTQRVPIEIMTLPMRMFDEAVIERMCAEWQPPDDPPTPGDPDELPDSPSEQPPDEPPGFPEPEPEQPPAEPPELSADTHLP